MKTKPLSTLVAAGLLAFSAAASAQTTAVPASPNPSTGGQASTQTPSGVPNPTQKPAGMVNSREAVRSEARVENKSPANTMVPKGEPSTMTNNQPNAAQPTGAMTRAEVRPTRNELKPQMGQKGERPDVPTNPKSETGTPK